MITLLDATKMAYRKHHLDDTSIGWDELSDILMSALCNEMGDLAFQNWLKEVSRRTKRPLDGATPEGFCECGISIESHTGVYCSFRPASNANR